MQSDLLTVRMGVFAELSELAGRRFGRTALMKLCYFLQVVKGVPLNYDFSLYSYGPFDSNVLSDLQTAEELQVLESTVEHYPGGYGYLIGQAKNAKRVRGFAAEFLQEHHEDIKWVADTWANRTASELELASTIIFVRREKPNVSDANLITLVRAIKPHFAVAEVKRQIDWLRDNKIFEEVAENSM